MHDPELETKIINTFALCFAKVRQGTQTGTLTGQEQIILIDQMATCFKDFIELQRSYVGAAMAIEKAKV